MALEILAPAGGPQQLRAAVRSGADAVYLGATSFSARSGAQNFAPDALPEVVRYCHQNGVRVHLALNTLLRQDELTAAMAVVDTAVAAGIDALIAQDLGLAQAVHQRHPQLPLHGSTQMSIHSLQGVRMLQSLGFTRAILARELTLAEIGDICRQSPTEIEVFVHGALCMSVSGQCLLSAVIGGRSGNRGRCAGTCRLPWQVCGRGGHDRHDLSLKDLCALDYLPQLAEMGVASVKIEGRLKRPEYVASTTYAAHCARAGKPYDRQRLQDLFSRSGFTDGFLTGHTGQEMFGWRREDDARNTAQALQQAMQEVVRPDDMRPAAGGDKPLYMQFLLDGEAAVLTARSGDKEVCCRSERPQLATGRPTAAEAVKKALGKTGGTPFVLRDCRVEVDELHFLPVSAINGLRRQALKQLGALCSEDAPATASSADLPPFAAPAIRRPVPAEQGLRARFETVAQLGGCREVLGALERIYLPLGQLWAHADDLAPLKDKLVCEMPRMLFGGEAQALERARALWERGFTRFEANNLAHIGPLREMGGTVLGGAPLNTFSAQTALCYRQLGVGEITLSPELRQQQLGDFPREIVCGAIGYGYLPVMVLRACPLRGKKGCAGCDRRGALTDRTGKRFAVLCQGGYSYLLNALPIDMGDRRQALRACDYTVLYFTVEDPAACRRVIDCYSAGQRSGEAFTRGLYLRGVL